MSIFDLMMISTVIGIANMIGILKDKQIKEQKE